MRARLTTPAVLAGTLAALVVLAGSAARLTGEDEAERGASVAAPEAALPPSRPRAVEPVAGEQGVVAAPAPGEQAGTERGTDVPPAGRRIASGAPSDAEIRRELRALAREQAKVRRVLLDSSAPIRQGSGRFVWPVFGPVTSPFCERRSWERCHPGVDIAAAAGTAVRAVDSGQVVLAGPQGGYGNYTCVAHSASLSTCYAHQSAVLVTPGQVVSRGQVIGAVGCTGFCFGDHLHFEVRVGGEVTNPLGYL